MITKGQYYDVVHLSKVDKLTTSQIAKKVNLDKKTVTKWLDKKMDIREAFLLSASLLEL